MSSKIRKKKKFKATGQSDEPDDQKLAPHSFIITRGKVSKPLGELMESLRKVMSPYTASNLKTTSKNVLKDYVAIAGPLQVSHLIILSQTKVSPVMKIARLPQGPTVYFRINSFSTIGDVLTHVEGSSLGDKLYHYQPLVAVNNFDYSLNHHVLTSSMLQNMFPKLNVTKLNLNKIKRCVLFHYDSTQDVIEFRQYRIQLLAPDMSRSVKKLTGSLANTPDLSSYKDIADFVMKSGFSSAGSDMELTQIVESANPTSGDDSTGLATTQSRLINNPSEDAPKKKKLKSRRRLAVRLIEFGPRMQLKLYKIEQGICEGEVLYHSVFSKSPEEMDQLIEKHKFRRKRPRHQFSVHNPNRPPPGVETEDGNGDSKKVKFGFQKMSNVAKKPEAE
ncbi:suppressor of SWI4 1 homolog [Convolutriloba macropyga]|uniref:suppressor of SWI4 1 homolog n=1 Tax=Convolutriloba macropyga TaxID=536237 RepID=UPI003F5239D4